MMILSKAEVAVLVIVAVMLCAVHVSYQKMVEKRAKAPVGQTFIVPAK